MAFYKYMLKIKAISWKTWPLALIAYLSYRFSCKNITFLHRLVHKWVLSKVNSSKILNIIPEFIKNVVYPKLRKSLLEQIEKAKAQGHRIALLSSSPDFIVNEVASCLKINLTLASSYPILSNDRFCRNIFVIRGENKASWIEEFMSLNPGVNQVIAYSDAMEDLPMLLKADVKYAVFPESLLKDLSFKSGWQLILS